MDFWCWLFGACVAATPVPAPVPAPVPTSPPPVAARVQPAPAAERPAVPSSVPPAPAAPAQAALPAAHVMTRPRPPAAIRPAPAPAAAAPVRVETGAREPAKFQPPAPAPVPAPAPESAASMPAAAAPPPVAGPPAWQRFAVAAPAADGKPTLAVVLDDMGANPVQSARALALPGPLALAWLPSAPQLAAQRAAATAHGDENLLAMPMEALGRADPGPDALRTWLPAATNLQRLRAALDAVPDAVALSPHDGAVASLSVPLMDLVMGELAARRLGFVDNPATPRSVALGRAAAAGLAVAARGVLIDGDPSPAAIHARLAEAEAIALRTGHAVAIGHARQTTLDVLEQDLPTLPARGVVLGPVSASLAAAAAGSAPRPAVRTTASAGEAAIAPAAKVGAE